MRSRNSSIKGSLKEIPGGSVGVHLAGQVDRYERGAPDHESSSAEHPEAHHSDLAHYTRIQASFSAALAEWQQRWSAITSESLAALAAHGIAISFRQSACGGYVATLLHEGGGGIDSGLCSSLEEAQHLVLGHSLEDPRR